MRNKRTALGFLLSLMLHALLVWVVWEKKRDLLLPPPSSSPHPVKLDLKRFLPSAPPSTSPAKTPTTLPNPVKTKAHKTVTPAKKSSQKLVEKKNKPQKAKKDVSKPTKPLQKPKPKKPSPSKPEALSKAKRKTTPHSSKKPRPTLSTETPVVRKQSAKTHRTHKDKLAGFLSKGLYTPHRPTKSSSLRRTPPELTRLYGKEYYSFTKEQRSFIRNHLSEIQRITQNTLVRNGYPEVALQTHQQGTNVVSFYLHPNGDISDLKILKPTGYEALDKNTLEVIRIAYMHYPRPKTKTKIIFYVNYSLY